MGKRGAVRIGCSGWNYRHWRGRFYPEKQPPREWFSFYTRFFDTVEINNTFYRLPPENVFEGWKKQAPAGFVYAVKANRFLTHIKRLKDAREPLGRFLERARLLGGHLGPILYQLPPRWRANLERLEGFLEALPPELVHVFEFRDRSWLVEEIYRCLDDHGVSFCVHDMPGLEVPRQRLGPVAYVRLHGAHAKYSGGYPAEALRDWWGWMKGQVNSGRDVYVYFNNDIEAHAVRDALRLKQEAGQDSDAGGAVYLDRG